MERVINKITAKTFPVLLMIIAWLIKAEISEVSHTLREIKSDVRTLNQDNLLMKQEINFRFKAIEAQIIRFHP